MNTFSPEAPAVIKALANDIRWQLVQLLSHSDRTTHELSQRLNVPDNQVTHHMTTLIQAGLAKQRRSSVNELEVYYSVDLPVLAHAFRQASENLHPALLSKEQPETAASKLNRPLRLLFLCTHNSARSQMAEGLARHFGNGRIEAFSAGTESTFIKPEAIEAMRQRGIDITSQQSEVLTKYLNDDFDYVITVCDSAKETCPYFSGGKHQIHWSFADPSDEPDPQKRQVAFNRTARELATRIQFLIMMAARTQGTPAA